MRKTALYLVLILLIFLPFHAFLTQVISFLQPALNLPVHLWKDIILGVLIILAILHTLRHKARLNPSLLEKNLLALWLLAFILLIINFTISPNTQTIIQWGWGVKYSLEYLLLFLVVRIFNFSWTEILVALRTLSYATIIVLLWGLWVKFFANETFLQDILGYTNDYSPYQVNVPLPFAQLIEDTSILRLQSTFAGPNQYAMFLLIMLPIFATLFFNTTKNTLIIIFSLAFFYALYSLFFTFSRSAYIAVFMQLVIALSFYLKQKGIPYTKMLIGMGLTLILITILSWIFYDYLPLFIQKPASTIAHFDKTISGAILSLQHPFGLGLGFAGPASWRFTPLIPENMFIGWSLEFGWLGLGLFLSFFYLIIKNLLNIAPQLLKKFPTQSIFLYATILIVIGFLGMGLFLHPIESSDNMMIFAIILAFSINTINQCKISATTGIKPLLLT